MITTGSKLFFGITGLAVAATAIYGWGSRGGLSGVLTLGFDGGVGEQAGYIVLASLAGVAASLGVVVVAFRDADVEAVAEIVGPAEVEGEAEADAEVAGPPEALAPAGPSYWPAVGAFSVALVLLGLVISPVLFVLGLIGAGVVAVEWMVQAWSDRATGDPEANRQVRNRIMYPLEIPLAGALAIFVVVAAVSRVFLALPKAGSTVVAIVAALLILVTAALIAARPRFSRGLVTAALVVGAVAVLVGGVVAAATGEREFHPHTEEEEGEAP